MKVKSIKFEFLSCNRLFKSHYFLKKLYKEIMLNILQTKKKQMKKNETSAPSTSKDKTQANKKIDAGSASKAKVKGRKK